MLTFPVSLRSSAACRAESAAHAIIESNARAQELPQVHPALAVLAEISGTCRGFSSANAQGFLDPFAMVFPMGTLKDTKEKAWTWILGAPLSAVTKAGVDFDPDCRSTTAVQGDASSGSALGVSHLLFYAISGKSGCLVPAHGLCKNGCYSNARPGLLQRHGHSLTVPLEL